MKHLLGNIALASLTITLAALMLWHLAAVPPVLTLAGGLAWAALAKAITLDEDRPGGARNPGHSARLWLVSRMELVITCLLLAALIVFALISPERLGLSGLVHVR